MTQLHKQNIRDFRYVKYIRNHLLNYYDELHQKNTFFDQDVDMYPERTTPRPIKKRKTKIRINENFDANVNEFSDDEKNEQKALDEPDKQHDNNMKYE